MRFSDILGHKREINLLKKGIENNRCASTYLFSGLEGIGKRLVARAFAAALNCEEYTGDACGRCPSCTLIASGTHPNLLLVEPEGGTLKVDLIRELKRLINYRIDRGRRVVIIEGAHLMVRATSNILLKTLEEPPPDTVMILISSRPDSLLPTILSRCQRINFSPLKEDAIKEILHREGYTEPSTMEIACRLSCGSAKRALMMASEGIIEKRQQYTAVLSMDDVTDTELLDMAERLSKEEHLEELLESFKTLLRDALIYRVAPSEERIINTDMLDAVGRCTYSVEELLSAYSLVEKTRESILPPNTLNKRLAMEALLVSLKERRWQGFVA